MSEALRDDVEFGVNLPLLFLDIPNDGGYVVQKRHVWWERGLWGW